MTTVHTLSSGSSGNAAVLSCGETHLLLDAGISCRRIETALRSLGIALNGLTAICITHTHSDHIAGLSTLLKRTACPILGSGETCSELYRRIALPETRLSPLPMAESVAVGSVQITAIPTAHDAAGSCGYRFDCPDGSVGLLTDTGYITREAQALLPGVDLAILEANHDVETLLSGPYPYYLKERILGDGGHLSNEVSAEFAVTLARSGAGEIILAHLSRENNTPAMAENAVARALCASGLSPRLRVAPRDTVGGPYYVKGTVLCKK